MESHEGMLWIKAIFKIIVILAFGIVLFMFNHVLGLAALLYGYFSLPMKYSIKKPFKAAQAWLRLIIAGSIVGVIFLTFSTAGGALSGAAWSLAILSIAFFFVFPHREEPAEVEGFAGGKWLGMAYGGKGFKSGEAAGRYIFIGLFIVGVLINIAPFMALTGWLQGIVWAILFICGVGGALAGRATRPMMGLLMIGIMMFAFSFAYTETVGRVMFGYWWPQIESGVSFIAQPLTTAYRGLQDMWTDTTLLATCPQCYYQRQLIKQQAAASAEGTTSSLSFSDFRLLPSEMIEPTLSPKSGGKSAVYLQVSNAGEFAAENLKVTLPTPLIKVKKSVVAGAVTTEVLNTPVSAGKVTVQSCSGGEVLATKDGCIWNGLTYPGGVRMATFQIDWDSMFTATNTEKSMTYFIYSGETVPISPKISFNYFVNVIYPIRVMKSDALDAALIAKRIDLTEQIAKYSGGPLKASLWTPLQPLRSGEKTVVTASLENTQDGDVQQVNYCIYVPKVGNNMPVPENIAGSIIGDGDRMASGTGCEPQQGTWVAKCYWNEIKSQVHCGDDVTCNIKRCSFYVSYDIGDNTERTFSFNGVASYGYSIEGGKNIVVTAASAEQAAGRTTVPSG